MKMKKKIVLVLCLVLVLIFTACQPGISQEAKDLASDSGLSEIQAQSLIDASEAIGIDSDSIYNVAPNGSSCSFLFTDGNDGTDYSMAFAQVDFSGDNVNQIYSTGDMVFYDDGDVLHNIGDYFICDSDKELLAELAKIELEYSDYAYTNIGYENSDSWFGMISQNIYVLSSTITDGGGSHDLMVFFDWDGDLENVPRAISLTVDGIEQL